MSDTSQDRSLPQTSRETFDLALVQKQHERQPLKLKRRLSDVNWLSSEPGFPTFLASSSFFPPTAVSQLPRP